MKRYCEPSRERQAKAKHAAAAKRLAALKRELEAFDVKYAVRLSEDCVAAFVVFNCEDSKRHCLSDYHRSGTWWRQLTQVRLLMQTVDGSVQYVCRCGCLHTSRFTKLATTSALLIDLLCPLPLSLVTQPQSVGIESLPLFETNQYGNICLLAWFVLALSPHHCDSARRSCPSSSSRRQSRLISSGKTWKPAPRHGRSDKP